MENTSMLCIKGPFSISKTDARILWSNSGYSSLSNRVIPYNWVSMRNPIQTSLVNLPGFQSVFRLSWSCGFRGCVNEKLFAGRVWDGGLTEGGLPPKGLFVKEKIRGVILFMLMEHKGTMNTLLYRFQDLDSSSKPPRTGNRFMKNLECHSDAWKGLNCLDAVYQLDGVGSDIGRSSWLLLLKHKAHSTAVSQRAGVTDSAPSEHWGLLIQGPFPCYTHRQIHSQNTITTLCTKRCLGCAK